MDVGPNNQLKDQKGFIFANYAYAVRIQEDLQDPES